MLRNDINPALIPAIAPGEVRVYGLDWTELLRETADTIATSEWACTDAGVTVGGATHTDTETRILVTVAADVAVGRTLTVRNTITAGVQTLRRTLLIEVRDL